MPDSLLTVPSLPSSISSNWLPMSVVSKPEVDELPSMESLIFEAWNAFVARWKVYFLGSLLMLGGQLQSKTWICLFTAVGVVPMLNGDFDSNFNIELSTN